MAGDDLDGSDSGVTVPQEHVVFTDLDGIEGVLVDLNTRKYYQLNETATMVWRGLERRLTTMEIAAEMAAVYDVPADRAVTSVKRLLDSLGASKLVKGS
jgi:hypothetical protein